MTCLPLDKCLAPWFWLKKSLSRPIVYPEIGIALDCIFTHKSCMLSRVCSAAVNGIDAFAVEVEVNCGFGDSFVAIVATDSQ
jgi:hypothetical protein